MVSSKSSVKSIPVNPRAITNTLTIYGPGLPGVLVKQIRNKPPRVETGTEHIPNDLHMLYHFFTLIYDMMFVNGVAFFTALFKKIILVTSENIPTRTSKQLGNSLTNVVTLYARGSFLVNIILIN